jgi:hypothetical protein
MVNVVFEIIIPPVDEPVRLPTAYLEHPYAFLAHSSQLSSQPCGPARGVGYLKVREDMEMHGPMPLVLQRISAYLVLLRPRTSHIATYMSYRVLYSARLDIAHVRSGVSQRSRESRV